MSRDLLQLEAAHKRLTPRDGRPYAPGVPLSRSELEGLARIYKILGDPTRLKIVTVLHRHETCVGDLAALAGISESAVSHQLRRLKDLALVKSRRAGQTIYYALDDDHVALLLEAGMKHVREAAAAPQRP
jgi:DNA-binding transcriptional ArsR family regulator